MTDLTKAPKEIVVGLINAANGTNVPAELLDAGTPSVTVGARNTTLTMTAAAGSGYSGSVDFTYNRLHLQTDILDASGKTAEFALGDATTKADFIVELNALLEINLTPDDFEDGPLPDFDGTPNEVKAVQLVAKEDSLCYIGSLTFNVKGEDIPLSSIFTVTELTGLTYEPPAP